MGKLLLTGTAGTAAGPCALCAAAVAAAFAIAAATGGCAEQFDYVKPSATTATAGHGDETAPQEGVRAPGAGASTPATHE